MTSVIHFPSGTFCCALFFRTGTAAARRPLGALWLRCGQLRAALGPCRLTSILSPLAWALSPSGPRTRPAAQAACDTPSPHIRVGWPRLGAQMWSFSAGRAAQLPAAPDAEIFSEFVSTWGVALLQRAREPGRAATQAPPAERVRARLILQQDPLQGSRLCQQGLRPRPLTTPA